MTVILDVHFPKVILHEFDHFSSWPYGIIFLSTMIDFGGVFSIRSSPFWDDVFILGHSHLPNILRWELTSCLWLLLLMDYRDDDILRSISSTHLVRHGYPFTYVSHLYVLPLTLLYLHPCHLARTLLIFHFESTFLSSYRILSHSLDQRRGCRPILSFLVECSHTFGH